MMVAFFRLMMEIFFVCKDELALDNFSLYEPSFDLFMPNLRRHNC